MVEVIAESHYMMLQPISCRYSTCLQQWQGKYVGYSSNSLTCSLCGIWPKWPNGGFSCATIEEMQYLIKKPRAEVSEEKKRGVEFPGHGKMKPMMERHQAMIRQNHMDCCLPSQHHKARNPQTCWRRSGLGAPPPVRRRDPTPDVTPSLSRMPPVPPGPIQGTQWSKTIDLPAADADSRVSLLKTQPVNLDALAEHSIPDEDSDPELLTDERTSCG